MKPIEVRGYVLDILLGGFTHAAIHYAPQVYKHIQGGLSVSQALETVIGAAGGEVGPGRHRTQ